MNEEYKERLFNILFWKLPSKEYNEIWQLIEDCIKKERERIRKEVIIIDWDITSFDMDRIIFNHDKTIFN
jgi:hypothetical protein